MKQVNEFMKLIREILRELRLMNVWGFLTVAAILAFLSWFLPASGLLAWLRHFVG